MALIYFIDKKNKMQGACPQFNDTQNNNGVAELADPLSDVKASKWCDSQIQPTSDLDVDKPLTWTNNRPAHYIRKPPPDDPGGMPLGHCFLTPQGVPLKARPQSHLENVSSSYEETKPQNADGAWPPLFTAACATYYKVRYRAAGLGTDNITTSDAGLSTYTIDPKIMGQLPFTSAQYVTGISYTDSLVGGAATAVVASTNSSYLYVTYNAEFTGYATDTFKLVAFAEEVVRGQYQNLPNVNCKSPGIITAAPGTGTVVTAGAPTKPSFAINIPTTGGRYLLCYKKTGLDVLLKLESTSGSATNPFRVIPNSLSFSYNSATGNFTVTDLFSALVSNVDTALGAVSLLDKIYMVNSGDTCGISHGYAYSATAPTSNASIAANIDNAPVVLKGTSSVSLSMQAPYTAPTAVGGYYKLCYQRTSTTTMAGTGPQPYTRTTYVASTTPGSWFQIDNNGLSSTGGNTTFYVTSKATKLRINKCPAFNASMPLRTGQPVEISVSVLDAQNVMLPFAGSATNPFRVIPNSLSFSCNSATGNLFSALVSSVDTALGAVKGGGGHVRYQPQPRLQLHGPDVQYLHPSEH